MPPIIVYTPGCWDLLHVGHLNFLERASRLGTALIVGVASDEVIIEDKKQPPTIPLVDRVRMVQGLRCVALAVPYYQFEFLTHLDRFHPDILAVGRDWGSAERHLNAEKWCSDYGRIVRLPYTEGVSSSSIKQRLQGSKQ